MLLWFELESKRKKPKWDNALDILLDLRARGIAMQN